MFYYSTKKPPKGIGGFGMREILESILSELFTKPFVNPNYKTGKRYQMTISMTKVFGIKVFPVWSLIFPIFQKSLTERY
jgi:hypothetical protein